MFTCLYIAILFHRSSACLMTHDPASKLMKNYNTIIYTTSSISTYIFISMSPMITIYLIGKDLHCDHCIHHYNNSLYYVVWYVVVVVVARFFIISNNVGQANLVSMEFELLPTIFIWEKFSLGVCEFLIFWETLLSEKKTVWTEP